MSLAGLKSKQGHGNDLECRFARILKDHSALINVGFAPVNKTDCTTN